MPETTLSPPATAASTTTPASDSPSSGTPPTPADEAPTPAVLPDALYDVHSVKRALDDELIVLLEGSGYVERTGPIDAKLLLSVVAIGASLYSHLAPGTYPATRPFLLVCVGVYVTAVVLILAIGFIVERDAFFCGVPGARALRLAERSARRKRGRGCGSGTGAGGLPVPLPGGVYVTSTVGKPTAGVPVAGLSHSATVVGAPTPNRSMYCMTLKTRGRSRASASLQRPYEEYFTEAGVLLEARFAADVADVLRALKGKKRQ